MQYLSFHMENFVNVIAYDISYNAYIYAYFDHICNSLNEGQFVLATIIKAKYSDMLWTSTQTTKQAPTIYQKRSVLVRRGRILPTPEKVPRMGSHFLGFNSHLNN